jgi:hypothetical protein
MGKKPLTPETITGLGQVYNNPFGATVHQPVLVSLHRELWIHSKDFAKNHQGTHICTPGIIS